MTKVSKMTWCHCAALYSQIMWKEIEKGGIWGATSECHTQHSLRH